MRLTNILYDPHTDLSKILDEHGISTSEPLLVQIFSGIPKVDSIAQILDHVSTVLPNAAIIGTTTGGEMLNGLALDETIVLSICQAEYTTFDTTLIVADNIDDYQLGRKLCASPDYEHVKVVITFATGLTTNGDEIIRGIASVHSNLVIAGGMAGDNRQFQKTYVFTKDGITDQGAVAVGFFNHRLQIAKYYSLDWAPLGQPMDITRAKKNRVYTIDKSPAMETYKRYLGKDVSDRMPVLGIQFPLTLTRQGKTVARTCIRINADGSLEYMGNIIEGDEVRFALGDPNSVVKSLQAIHESLVQDKPEVIFVYSSMARKRMMKHSASLEAHYLQTVAPTAGFFTYGEFFNLPEGNEFFNYTMTVLGLSEGAPAECTNHDVEALEPTDTHLELRALSNLVSITSRELEHVNKSLEELATTDPLTCIFNRRKMNNLIEGEIVRRVRYGRRAALVLLDFDNFKIINDTHGHDMGDIVIKSVTEAINKMIRNTDYLGRWGGDEFIVLSTETSSQEALATTERIRQHVEETHNDDIKITLSAGVTEIRPNDNLESLIKRADKALYRAKHSGKNSIEVE